MRPTLLALSEEGKALVVREQSEMEEAIDKARMRMGESSRLYNSVFSLNDLNSVSTSGKSTSVSLQLTFKAEVQPDAGMSLSGLAALLSPITHVFQWLSIHNTVLSEIAWVILVSDALRLCSADLRVVSSTCSHGSRDP